jgi:glutaredoxin
MDGCEYCDTLKDMLDEKDVEYLEIDVLDKKDEFEKIVKISGEDSVPTIIVGKQILAPKKTFNTIEEAFKIIIKLM